MTDSPTLQMLAELNAIERLKYTYQRCLDVNDWDGVASCLAPDAECSYDSGAYTHRGRDEIVAFLQSTTLAKPTSSSSHVVAHPVIDFISSSEARGTWMLTDTVVDREAGTRLQGAAYYHDRYRKDTDGWKITSIGYERLYEHRDRLPDATEQG